MELISASQIYNCDFIHKLLIIQWNQGCHVVAEVSWQKLNTICYIYIVYKHISKRQSGLLFIWSELYTQVSGTHPLQTFKKNTQIVTGDPCVLFHWRRNAREGLKSWENKNHSRAEKTLQMDYNKERVYTENKYRKTVWKDLLHSCIVYMRKLFGSTTLIGWTVISMYSSGPHRQKWQTYFKMIFSLTACW